LNYLVEIKIELSAKKSPEKLGAASLPGLLRSTAAWGRYATVDSVL
jgi:hypothetical protein